MKKWKRIVNSLIVTLIITVIVLVYGWNSKPIIMSYVRHNSKELERFADSIIASDSQNNTRVVYNGWRVYSDEQNDSVSFSVREWGIAPSSVIEGLYYSADDEPFFHRGKERLFIRYGNGWRWEEEKGDDWRYIERIVNNWYWFKEAN